MTRGRGMLRFESEEDAKRHMQDRRDRFNNGGRIVVPERDTQAAILDLLSKHPSVAFAKRMSVAAGFLVYTPVWKRLVAAGHVKEGEARFMRFGFPGMYDITGMLRGDGRRLEIEVKADPKKPTEDQVAFGQAVNVGGGLAITAYSVDDVLRRLPK